MLLRRPDHLLARWNEILVWVGSGSVDDEILVEVRRCLKAIAEEHPGGAALLMVARGQQELPKLEMRRTIVRGLASLGERLQGVAAVCEGEPRWVGAARLVLDRMLAVTPGAFPLRVLVDREEAILWLGEIVVGPEGRPIDIIELAPFVEEAVASAGRPQNSVD